MTVEQILWAGAFPALLMLVGVVALLVRKLEVAFGAMVGSAAGFFILSIQIGVWGVVP